jgi:hypothetical protein
MSRRSRTNCAVANWKVCARLICGLNCQSKFSKGSRSGNCHQLLAPLSPPVAATFWFQSYNRSLPRALHSPDSAFVDARMTIADNAEYKKVPSIPPTIFTETVAPSRSV